MLLAFEKDEVLVERLLTPLLWNGKIPAISRRAFVEGELVNDLPVITEKDWRWQECPIIFDWHNSRGILPGGYSRQSRDVSSIKISMTEYFRIEVSWEILREEFSCLGERRTDSNEAILRSGVVGQPTSRHVIEDEIKRRIESGERYLTKRAAAEALSQWLLEAYGGKAPKMGWKAMTNSLSEQLSALVDSSLAKRSRTRPE